MLGCGLSPGEKIEGKWRHVRSNRSVLCYTDQAGSTMLIWWGFLVYHFQDYALYRLFYEENNVNIIVCSDIYDRMISLQLPVKWPSTSGYFGTRLKNWDTHMVYNLG